MVLKALMPDIRKLETEAVIVGFHEDVRPLKGAAGALDWILCGSLSRLILTRKISGALGDVALLTTKGKIPATKLFMVGLGPRAEGSAASLREAARTAASSAVGAGISRALIDCFPLGNADDDHALRALAEGFRDGAAGSSLELTLYAPDPASYDRLSRFVAS